VGDNLSHHDEPAARAALESLAAADAAVDRLSGAILTAMLAVDPDAAVLADVADAADHLAQAIAAADWFTGAEETVEPHVKRLAASAVEIALYAREARFHGHAVERFERRVAAAGPALEALRFRLRRVMPIRPPADAPDAEPVTENAVARAVLAALGNESTGSRIITIAQDRSKTVDERMSLIAALESQAVSWDSAMWALILGVTAAAIRQCHWWRTVRPRLRGDSADD
jgi:hypothetical protein